MATWSLEKIWEFLYTKNLICLRIDTLGCATNLLKIDTLGYATNLLEDRDTSICHKSACGAIH